MPGDLELGLLAAAGDTSQWPVSTAAASGKGWANPDWANKHQIRLSENPSGGGLIGDSRSCGLLDALEQPCQAALEDRGVRGAFLSCRSSDGNKVELPLSFADIERDGATLTITVHKEVHPDCELGGKPVALTSSGGADEAESWKVEMEQAIENVNGKHWGTSKSFIRAQQDRWEVEGRRSKDMTVAEYFVDIGLGHVYDSTWSWVGGEIGKLLMKNDQTPEDTQRIDELRQELGRGYEELHVLEEAGEGDAERANELQERLNAKGGPMAELTWKKKQSNKDRKELNYYLRKVNKTELYEDMELTDYMNVLKYQDLVPAGRKVSYADFIHAEVDSTGRRMVGKATVFVSHVWKMRARDFFEVCLTEMKESDYAWVDLYLHNQYQGAVSSIGAENSEYWVNKFGELVGGIGRVVAIVTDWEEPVMLTRIWCLFELNAAIDTGAELRFVATAAERLDLSLNLNEKFKILDAVVSSIEVRDCDAKRPHEIQDKVIFLGKLRGVEDEVNRKLRKEMQRWLAESALAVVGRTDPSHPTLGQVEMERELVELGEKGAKRSRQLDRYPRVPVLLHILSQVILAAALWVWSIAATAAADASDAASGSGGDDVACWGSPSLQALLAGESYGCGFIGIGLGWCGLLICAFGGYIQAYSATLAEHQVARQLRRPHVHPMCFDKVELCGEIVRWVFRQVRTAGALGAVVVFGIMWWRSRHFWSALLDLYSVIILVLGLDFALRKSSNRSAADRAALSTKAGWLQLRLGDANAAVDTFSAAHVHLRRAIGTKEARFSYLITAPGYCRALCDAGRHTEAEDLRKQIADQAVARARRPWDRANDGRADLSSANGSSDAWEEYGPLLQASLAVAMRQSDSVVLGLLVQGSTIHGCAGCPTLAGSRPLGEDEKDDGEETGLPEWVEFLQRMDSGSGGDTWTSYTATTAHNRRQDAEHRSRQRKSAREAIRAEAEAATIRAETATMRAEAAHWQSGPWPAE
eukprot:COSAG06_NODE_1138_length_10565_cov_16.902446_8_plen_983_part_00